MKTVKLSLDPAFVTGPVRRQTFGTFVEHLGRCVYTGIYEPDHPSADEEGFRTDVLELVKELGVSTVRYPGGNFVSGYKWEDGIGPRDQRPTRLDLAWHSRESNAFGLNEFMKWTKATGTEPMMAVNLGTRGIQEALDILEYSNVESGTALSDLRHEHGSPQPHNITFWCLGNEMDGPWQLGHKTAYEYGRLAAETARAMRQMYPDLTLVACGSSSSNMPEFGEWERIVLQETYDDVDLISAHAYYQVYDGDLGSFLASAMDMDHFIKAVAATADAVGAARKSKKKINISFDEWNVWYQSRVASEIATGDDWPFAPRILEDQYNVADAVVVGNLLISLLRHTDRVHSASMAQLVNVIGPIMTEPGGPAWKQTTFHPFALTSKYARGQVLTTIVDGPTYDNERFGSSPIGDAVATWDEETGALTIFAVNRDQNDEATLELDLSHWPGLKLEEAVVMSHSDYTWSASAEDSTTVLPVANTAAQVADGKLTAAMPPISWNMIRLQVA